MKIIIGYVAMINGNEVVGPTEVGGFFDDKDLAEQYVKGRGPWGGNGRVDSRRMLKLDNGAIFPIDKHAHFDNNGVDINLSETGWLEKEIEEREKATNKEVDDIRSRLTSEEIADLIEQLGSP